MKLKIFITWILISSFLTSCSDEAGESQLKSAAKNKTTIERKVDPVNYSKGARLYQLNCASCHGKNAEGARDWRTPDKDGKNQPPPLNGTGHTWHHSTEALTRVIKSGTGKIGGNMPAWKDKLSESDISLILIWITAQWPDEIYTAWYNQFHQQN